MDFAWYSRNGELRPASEAVIGLANIEYAYGFGVYETIRASGGKANFLAEHVERLMESARIIGLEHRFDAASVTAAINELVTKTGDGVFNLKVLLIGARDPARTELCVLPLAPLFPDKRLYARGASAVSFSYERLFPQAKTLNMFPSYYAYREAKAKGCYDALFINRDGCITEGTRTNFFAIKGDVIHSPPAKDVLEGVTRRHVLAAARNNGFGYDEAPVALADIGSYDGAFLTSTSSKIMPLTTIDAFTWPAVPDALKRLIALYDEERHRLTGE